MSCHATQVEGLTEYGELAQEACPLYTAQHSD